MTNRYSAGISNRKSVNRLKSIRDRKKSNSVGKRRATGKMTRTLVLDLNKKQEKRQARLAKIYKAHNVSDKLVEKKVIKRRNKNNKNYVTVDKLDAQLNNIKNVNMNID